MAPLMNDAPQVVVSEASLQKAEEFIEAEEGAANKLKGWLAILVTVLAFVMSVFHLYTAYAIVPLAIPIYNLTVDVNRELYIADGVIAGFIGLAIILLGRAVLSNNVLTERPQSSQGFFGR